jgi:hypothetical protein
MRLIASFIIFFALAAANFTAAEGDASKPAALNLPAEDVSFFLAAPGVEKRNGPYVLGSFSETRLFPVETLFAWVADGKGPEAVVNEPLTLLGRLPYEITSLDSFEVEKGTINGTNIEFVVKLIEYFGEIKKNPPLRDVYFVAHLPALPSGQYRFQINYKYYSYDNYNHERKIMGPHKKRMGGADPAVFPPFAVDLEIKAAQGQPHPLKETLIRDDDLAVVKSQIVAGMNREAFEAVLQKARPNGLWIEDGDLEIRSFDDPGSILKVSGLREGAISKWELVTCQAKLPLAPLQTGKQVVEMAGLADRIVIVPPKRPPCFREAPLLSGLEVLKGSTIFLEDQIENTQSLPRDGSQRKWILFLLSYNDGLALPAWKMEDPAQKNWFMVYNEEWAQRVREAIPLPSTWGSETNGLRMGLRFRQSQYRLGQEIPLEIFLKNSASYDNLSQFREYFCDYEDLSIEIMAPERKFFTLERNPHDMYGEIQPYAMRQESEEYFIHTVRLRKESNVFTKKGEYTIQAVYRASKNKLWNGELRSSPVTITVTDK